MTAMLKRILLTTVASGVWLAAQEPDIRVEVERVNLLVTLTDSKGRFAIDIDREQFEIYEDGKLQTITNFDRPTDLPIQLALLVDTSASVRTQIEFEKEAARKFVLALMQPGDRALLAEFDRGVSLVTDFTERPTVVAQAIGQLQAGGGTAIFDAIDVLAREKMSIGRGRDRKIMVLISDGVDYDSRLSRKDALRTAQSTELTIYAIGTNRFSADQKRDGWKVLEELTDKTGGIALFPYSVENLEESFEEINKELRSQYLLAYQSSNTTRDGAFRRIKVKVRNKPGGLRIRHRAGYYAPGE